MNTNKEKKITAGIRKILGIGESRYKQIQPHIAKAIVQGSRSDSARLRVYRLLEPYCRKLADKTRATLRGVNKKRYSDASCQTHRRFSFPFGKRLGFRIGAVVNSVRPPGQDVCAGSPSVEYCVETITPYYHDKEYYDGWNGYGDIDEAILHAVTKACTDTLTNN